MKNKIVNGTIVLIVAGVIAKVIGAFYRVPLIGIIGTGGMGLYQLIFPIFALFLILATSGISIGISKIVSVMVKDNSLADLKKFIKSSLSFSLLTSVVVSVIMAVLGKFISILQGCEMAYICYFAIAPSIVFSGIISVLKGYFQGMQNMVPTATVQVVEQLSKLIFSLFFAKVFSAGGTTNAVFGALLGVSLSEVISCLYIFIFIAINKQSKLILKNKQQSKLTWLGCIKMYISQCFPIMLNAVMIPLVSAVESVFVVLMLQKSGLDATSSLRLYGIEDGMISSLINVPTVVAVAITTAIIPSITVDFSKKDIFNVEKKSNLALKFVWLISVPCVIAYFFHASNILQFLYSSSLAGDGFNFIAISLLRFSSINIVYLSIMNATSGLLQAINKSRLSAYHLIFASVIKVVLDYLLVTNATFNIYGIVISDIVCYSLTALLNTISIRREIKLNIPFVKVVTTSLISGICMVIALKFSSYVLAEIFSYKILTIVSLVFSALIYIASLLALNVFTKEELFFMPKLKQNKTKLV